MMIISQAASIARHEIGMTAAAAAVSVSVIALFNMAGRLVAGILSDHLGRIAVLVGALCLSLAGLFTLMTARMGDFAQYYLGCVLVGLSFGAFMAITRALQLKGLVLRIQASTTGSCSAASLPQDSRPRADALDAEHGLCLLRLLYGWRGVLSLGLVFAAVCRRMMK
ncbi:MAG: hypothetical protein V8S69_02305 [Dakarella massiliensis]